MSLAANKVRDEIARFGELIYTRSEKPCEAARLIEYATLTTQTDVDFLEMLREDICDSLDAFDSLNLMDLKSRQVKLH